MVDNRVGARARASVRVRGRVGVAARVQVGSGRPKFP